jgi:hypothetical protein
MAIHPWDDEARTCMSCLYGRYHAAQSGALESPPQQAYCTCSHPRVLTEAVVYDPETPPDHFNCKFWTVQDGSDAPGLDADAMPFGEWLGCWRLDWATGELVEV